MNAAFGLVQMMSWTLSYQTAQLAESREHMRDVTAFAALEASRRGPVATPHPGAGLRVH